MFNLEVMKEHLTLRYISKDWGFHKSKYVSEKVKGTKKFRYTLCNLDAVYAIFSLEKVWQSHDFMHIFSIHPSQKLSQCRASDVKVTAKA